MVINDKYDRKLVRLEGQIDAFAEAGAIARTLLLLRESDVSQETLQEVVEEIERKAWLLRDEYLNVKCAQATVREHKYA